MARNVLAAATNAQRGWAFVIVLVALAIVAFLGRDALSSYFGVMRGGAAATANRLPPSAVVPDPSLSTPLPSTPIERARGVEDVVRDTATQRRGQIDGQAR